MFLKFSNSYLKANSIFKKSYVYYMGLDARKSVFGGLRTAMAKDQPAHPCSLIGAFLIRLLGSIISRLATREISLF